MPGMGSSRQKVPLRVERVSCCHAEQVETRVRYHRIGDPATAQEDQRKQEAAQAGPHRARNALVQMSHSEASAVNDDSDDKPAYCEGSLEPGEDEGPYQLFGEPAADDSTKHP